MSKPTLRFRFRCNQDSFLDKRLVQDSQLKTVETVTILRAPRHFSLLLFINKYSRNVLNFLTTKLRLKDTSHDPFVALGNAMHFHRMRCKSSQCHRNGNETAENQLITTNLLFYYCEWKRCINCRELQFRLMSHLRPQTLKYLVYSPVYAYFI